MTLEQIKQDARFGLRVLLKNRTFSSMALATMALAIGSTTAVFSLIDGVLIRPLPFADPDRLFDASDVGMRRRSCPRAPTAKPIACYEA